MVRKALVVLFALVAFMCVTPGAYADHPHEDDAKRSANGEPRDPNNPEPVCETVEEGEMYVSGNKQHWVCVWDTPQNIPEPVPGVFPGSFWEPLPDDPNRMAGGDNAYTRRWDPMPVPGYTNPSPVIRTGARTEWVNPNPASGNCPNVTGGCKLYGGADLELRRNGQPFALHRTWFNKALQLYVYNATTKAWEKKQDTGWMMGSATGPTYLSELVNTYAYGTAPNGAAWYFVRAQSRTWDGAQWSPARVQDPKTSTGTLDMVWDDPPGSKVKKPKKPTKAPKVEKVSKKGFTPPFVGPVEDADNTPVAATP